MSNSTKALSAVIAVLAVAAAILVIWNLGAEVQPVKNAEREDTLISAADAALHVGDRESSGPPERIRATDAKTGVFHGRLLCAPGANTALFGKIDEVTIARATQISSGSVRGQKKVTFTEFARFGGGGAVPVALAKGDRFRVENGGWTMPVPKEDLILVRVSAEDAEWSLQGDGVITKESHEGSYVVDTAPLCMLHVRDSVSHVDCSRLAVLSAVEMPQGVPFVMQHLPAPEREKKVDTFPVRGAFRQGVHPPSNARKVGVHVDSPIAIPAVNYDRELWVGGEGYAWRHVRLPAGSERLDLELSRAVALDVGFVGTAAYSGLLTMSILQHGQAVATWPSVTSGAVLSVESIEASPCVISIRFARELGYLSAYEEEIDIPHVARFSHSIDLSKIQAPKCGSLSVAIYDPEHIWGDGNEVHLALDAQVLRAVVGPGRQRAKLMDNTGVGDAPAVRVAEFERVPCGNYVVGIPMMGLQQKVAIREGVPCTANFDLSDIVSVKILPSPEVAARCEELVLDWQCQGQSADNKSVRAFHGQANWTGKEWVFRTVPGIIACRARFLRGGEVFATRAFVVGDQPAVFELKAGWRDFGLLSVAIKGLGAGADQQIIDVLMEMIQLPPAGKGGVFALKTATREGGCTVSNVTMFVSEGAIVKPQDSELVAWDSHDATVVTLGNTVVLSGRWRGK